MASKTSYTSVLLKSAMHSGKEKGETTAALIFNVKGEDLIWLDEAPQKGYELQDSDKAMYEAMGIPAEPFTDVTVYAPAMPAGARGTRSPRPDAIPMRWDLNTVWPYLRYFFSFDWYGDNILQAFINDFDELRKSPNPAVRVDTFQKFEDWISDQLHQATKNEEEGIAAASTFWKSHNTSSGRRFKRMFTTVPSISGGLVTKESAEEREDVPVNNWHHGEVVVVDIAGLTPDIQGIVIARTIDRVMKAAESGELGVEHLIISFDELNNFAPSVGREQAQVRKTLEKLASMGRYSGLSLWGAGQMLSKVADQITSNSASRALGRTADIELSSGAYGRLSAGITERIATLPKGQMVLWHYSFRAPLVVKFPRPAWRTGKAKTLSKRPHLIDALGLREKSSSLLTEGVGSDAVETILASSSSKEEAIKKLEAARVPDMAKRVVHEKTRFDPDNPFDL